MKIFKILTFLTAIVGITVLNCKEKGDFIKDGVLKVQNTSWSDCKSDLDLNREYMQYSTIDNNYLLIKYFNATLNCCPDSVLIISSISKSEIQFTICQKNNNCNCTCKYDIQCKIGPLEYGSFPFNIDICSGTSAKFNLDFNQNTSGEFTIKNF